MTFFEDGLARFDDVSWGVSGCLLLVAEDGSNCHRPADLLWDIGPDGKGTPACAECADLVIERGRAIGENPTQARDLPPLRPW